MARAQEWRDRLAAAPHAQAAAGTLLALLAVTETLLRATGNSAWYLLVLSLLAVAGTLPLAFLPPAPAAVAVSAATVLSLAPFHSVTVAGAVAQLVVLYRLGSQLLAAALALPFLGLALTVHRQADVAVLLASLAMAAAWTGAARRARREAAAHTSARRDILSTLLEHSARGERARIARELHDIVAHHISMIAVQAETARLTTAGMPPAGAQRLSSIGDTARAALTEMRLLLGVLREDREDVDTADLQPQPGLRQLNELLDEARAATGAGTRLIIRGPADPLDPGVELAAYRIVQEALTNARRHAPGAAVDVELYYADDAVRLRIRDNGPGCQDVAPSGHGLLGMRERAAAVGGQVHTGPAPGGGFLVETVLPVKPELAG
jgi:signal transduction histidine kinase